MAAAVAAAAGGAASAGRRSATLLRLQRWQLKQRACTAAERSSATGEARSEAEATRRCWRLLCCCCCCSWSEVLLGPPSRRVRRQGTQVERRGAAAQAGATRRVGGQRRRRHRRVRGQLAGHSGGDRGGADDDDVLVSLQAQQLAMRETFVRLQADDAAATGRSGGGGGRGAQVVRRGGMGQRPRGAPGTSRIVQHGGVRRRTFGDGRVDCRRRMSAMADAGGQAVRRRASFAPCRCCCSLRRASRRWATRA